MVPAVEKIIRIISAKREFYIGAAAAHESTGRYERERKKQNMKRK
jgi:hypothetical protein